MATQVTIVGLGQVGASIGLALGKHKDLVERTGIDREPTVSQKAQKMGAIDHVAYNLPASVRNAGLVILAVPVDELRETLEVIAPDLKENTVVIDTSPVKSSVLAWAEEILPPNRHFMGLTPTFNPAYLEDQGVGVEAAHEDLFEHGLAVIVSPSGAPAPAIKIASDLIGLLGATPLFADPAEADGLLAASHLLPQIAAVALLNATVDQPGWREGRKLAGRPFAQATAPILHLDESKLLGQAAILNRENVVRTIDNLIHSLIALRDDILNQNHEALHQQMENALKGRELWWKQRQSANWPEHEEARADVPSPGDMLSKLIGFRRKSDKDKQ